MTGPERKPKLLFLVSEDWYFISHRLGLAVAAQQAGFDVTVATRVTKSASEIRDAGLNLLPISFDRSGLGPLSEARTLRQLTALYRQEMPDIVHHVAMKPVIYGSRAARAAGVTRVVNALMGLGFVFTSETTKARLLKPFVRQALKRALAPQGTRLIVQNGDDLNMMTNAGLIGSDKVRLIRGSGVDPAEYPVKPLPAGVPVIVLPARLLRDKGVEEFVAAAELVKKQGGTARFVLAGDPDPSNPASIPSERVADWVKQGLVEHLGWLPQSQMAEICASARAVCLPSYREGLPRALLEAAASGRALIATDVPGCREIVRPDTNGWLVPPRDPKALAGALLDAIGNPERCAKFGKASRAMVENEFSLAHVVDQTLGVYRELMSR